MKPKLLVTKNNNTINITLNRPEVHNAIDEELITLFVQVLTEIEHDDNTRVVIINANGSNFCAGADLNWMKQTIHASKEDNYQDAMQFAELLQRINHLNKPVICLVNGEVYGGGIGLVACSDIVIASEQTNFCFSEVKIGLSPATISPYVIAAMGERQARRYFLTAEKFSASTALSLGLVHQVVPAEKLTETALNFIKPFSANAPEAIASTKQLIQHLANKHINSSLIQETAEILAEIRVSAEGQEGMQAFLEKRQPKWKISGD